MDITITSKQGLIKSIIDTFVASNVKSLDRSSEYDELYYEFISNVKKSKDVDIELPLDYITRFELFELIKSGKVFINSSAKFKVSLTTKKPIALETEFSSKYVGNEFSYSFLDNHPGIINVDHLKDIPVDYEGLMAVPPTVLEYKNLQRFNIHRVIYDPVFIGRHIYTRVVISNKAVLV